MELIAVGKESVRSPEEAYVAIRGCSRVVMLHLRCPVVADNSARAIGRVDVVLSRHPFECCIPWARLEKLTKPPFSEIVTATVI